MTKNQQTEETAQKAASTSVVSSNRDILRFPQDQIEKSHEKLTVRRMPSRRNVVFGTSFNAADGREERHQKNASRKVEAGTPRIDELTAFIGDRVMLVPAMRGDKRNHCELEEAIPLEKMRDPAYRAQLELKSTRAVLGTDGLSVFEFAHHTITEDFLNRNPCLRNTMRTSRLGRMFVWLKIRDRALPESTVLRSTAYRDYGSIYGTGAVVIEGCLADSIHTYQQNGRPFVEVYAKQIRMPCHVLTPWASTPNLRAVA
jgi:hypothetical protein